MATKWIAQSAVSTGSFTRLSATPLMGVAWCGHQIHPMVGTIFENSHTSLQKWFYAIYLFTTTRHGVPALELQRQLGVAYPTALRMAHKIREHMSNTDGENPLDGDVEIDETYIGGKVSGGERGRGAPNKTIAFGMLDRDGDVMTKVVPTSKNVPCSPSFKPMLNWAARSIRMNFALTQDWIKSGTNIRESIMVLASG